MSIRSALLSLIMTSLAVSVPVSASADNVDIYDGKTHVSVTPYAWVPTINGTLGLHLSDFDPSLPPASTHDASLDVAPGRYLKELTALGFIDVEIRRGRAAFLTDYVNFNLNASHTDSLDLSAIAQTPLVVDGTIGLHVVPQFLTFGPSYTVVHTATSVLNLFVGGRVALISARSAFGFSNADGSVALGGSLAKSGTFSDALLGVYGHVVLAKKLSIPYYADAGTGTPTFTWQGYAGIRYGRLTASYRHMSYAGGQNLLLQSLRLDGPDLGYTFEF